MKKFFLLFSLALPCFLHISCNEAGNTDDNTASADPQISNLWIINSLNDFCETGVGLGNFIIDSTKAKNMSAHFDTLYGEYPQSATNIDALKRKFWLDSSTIFSISEALVAPYDGIRIHFTAATTPTLGYGVPYQNETGILIYPTVKSEKGHRDTFALITQCTYCPNPPTNIEDYATGKLKLDAFDSIYHKNSPAPNDPKLYSLSKAVWIEPCVIKYLASLIKSSGGKIDGISLMTAAYQNGETRLPLGAKATQSSTIIFVPTKPSGGAHVEDWSIIPDIIIGLKQKGIIITAGALNHGELCPQKCE